MGYVLRTLENIQLRTPKRAFYSKHWVLVFSQGDVAFTFEAFNSSGDVSMLVSPCPPSYGAFRLGSYYGRWYDLERIMAVHPQRGSLYSATFNNCQHFVALFLLFLNSVAQSKRGRHFSIDNGGRYAKVRGTLNFSGLGVWNKPNLVMATLNITTGASGVAVAAARMAGSQQSVILFVGQILGTLGVAETVMSSPYLNAFAAACVPAALGFAGLTTGTYFWKGHDWKYKAMADNPMLVGYPCQVPAPAFRTEPTCADTVEDFVLQNSVSVGSTGMASTVITKRYYANPEAFPDDVDTLFQLAGKIIK